MTLQRPAAARPSPDARLERSRREHKLREAIETARSLQARLEMLRDRDDDVRVVRAFRADLAGEIGRLPQVDAVVGGPPCRAFSRSRSDVGGPSPSEVDDGD